MPFLKGGKLRILAVTGRTRSPSAPEVPTFAEAGVPGMESGVWMSLLAPAETPKPVLARLTRELERAMAAPDVHERLTAVGAVPLSSTPEAAAERTRQDMESLAPIIRKLNLKPN